jgi:UDP-N-acetylglucosamine pyrophosphorylase
MRSAGLSQAAIRAFQHNYETLIGGHTGMIPENSIQPVLSLPTFKETVAAITPEQSLLAKTVVIKLNGGLGTSMGLERAKSLLPVKDGLTFLDFIVRQILYLRNKYGVQLRFLLMNSFSTSADTLAFLKKYPDLDPPESIELLQSQVPRVDARTFRPVKWPENPQLEWCPPGHGDVYPSLLGSGWLERLLAEGVKYAFVSNSDNLGATLDPALLTWFAQSEKPFLMEVANRTTADRKGGHLAQRNGQLLLRESAQCPESDQAAFQDIERHRFFNTNSIWLRLDALKKVLDEEGGFIRLPIIKNAKTVDPRNKNSPAVFQLETAMGAAIECFENAGAAVVPRSRFAPVKNTSDLLAVRSDAYAIAEDWSLRPTNPTTDDPPTIDLDSNHYKLLDEFEEKLADGVPSLKDCRVLTVRGPVSFNSKTNFKGKVSVSNPSAETRALPAGTYSDCVTEL